MSEGFRIYPLSVKVPHVATELLDELPARDFAEALRAGIQARGLSLERIQDRLRQRGVSISLATLSYWQSGRSQPERRESLAAVAGLEAILRLPEGALRGLLTAPRSRGRPIRQTMVVDLTWPRPSTLKAALAQVDTTWEDQLTRISVQDRVHIGELRSERSVRTRQVLRAEQDGPDRVLAIFALDDVRDSLPDIKVRRPGRIGRSITDPEAGILVTELMFDRSLAKGETFIVEYLLVHTTPGKPATRWERRFRYPAREYLVEVDFHPSALPARCAQYTVVDGPERTRSLTIDEAHSVHHVALAVPPSRCGIRWAWD